jgi:hypothetical protein
MLFVLATLLLTQVLPRFEDYKVALYRGAIHEPKWIRHVGGDEWRDHLGKIVDPPEINFAGKYFIAGHSCGTGCRFYTLTDLSSGRDLDVLTEFTTAEPPPKTRDGHLYITILLVAPTVGCSLRNIMWNCAQEMKSAGSVLSYSKVKSSRPSQTLGARAHSFKGGLRSLAAFARRR